VEVHFERVEKKIGGGGSGTLSKRALKDHPSWMELMAVEINFPTCKCGGTIGRWKVE
jgi:hypothetical protein